MTFIKDLNPASLSKLLQQFGINIVILQNNEDIPGSYWGAPEAGIILNQLYIRPDTPLHSALHESCHYICMDENRRATLHTDTGGDYDEENAVCYLQILLTDFINGVSRNQLCDDMDEWGYTFRLGSAKSWFENDADDANHWLQRNKIIDADSAPTWLINQ